MDGLSTRHTEGIGVVLQSPKGDKLKHKVRLQYQTINNEVEYEALLKGLELAKSVRVGRRVVFVLGSHPAYRKFSIDKRRRQSAKACVLYK